MNSGKNIHIQGIKIVRETIQAGSAEKILTKPIRLFSRQRSILKTALLYLPYYLFQCKVDFVRGTARTDKLCIDGLLGEYALYRDIELIPADDISFAPLSFILTPEEALERGAPAYKKELFKRSLKFNQAVKSTSFQLQGEFHYPYWIGYFKRVGALDFDVLDAVNGERQGVRLKPVFIRALMQLGGKVS